MLTLLAVALAGEPAPMPPDPTLAEGSPMTLTGAAIVRASDPAALASQSDVANVRILAGDGHVALLTLRRGADDHAVSRALAARADVEWAHPDYGFTPVPTAMPDDPFVGAQWHLENAGQSGGLAGVDVNAETAWAITAGAGTVVAVLDTGVVLDHPDLRVIPGHDYPGDDDDPSPVLGTDGAPHGTNAAGLAAATGDNGIGVAGVAYDAEVYAIRWLGGPTSISQLREALYEAADAGADVLSNSWGFGDGCPTFPTYPAMRDGLDYVEQHGRGGLGAALVMSAGNGNCDFSDDGMQKVPWVVSVAAVNRWDDREGYSAFGSLLDIAAPSGGVLTTDPPDRGYGSYEGDPAYYPYFTGTSAAAPIVAGTMALMFAANPRLTAAEARDVLCETATRNDVADNRFDASGWSPWVGCGRVDAGAAVVAVADTEPLAPVPTSGAEAWVDRVIFEWDDALDPDGDVLGYEVEWWPAYAPTAVRVEEVDGTRLDVTDPSWLGVELSWRVRTVAVLERPIPEAPTGGCQSSRPGPAWLGLALVALLRRRR